MHIINVAHGALLILAAYLTWEIWHRTGIDPIALSAITMPIMFVFGWILYQLTIRRIQGGPPSMSVLMTFGIALALAGMSGVIWSNDFKSVTPGYFNKAYHVGNFFIPATRLYACGVAVAVLVALWLLLTKTWLGRAIRASAQNREGARLMGIDVTAVAALTFALGAGTTGAGGSLISLVYPFFPAAQNILLLCFLIGILASGWNIVSGYTGYASLGQGAFLGFGAYATALLALHTGASVWWFVPVGGIFACFVAALLGLVSMRTRGHSFVIITIALIYISQLIALNWSSLTGGSRGLTLPLTTYPREWQNTPFYYVLLLLLALSVALSWWVRRTKFGMGLLAIREDEDKAVAIGVNGLVYKVLAFIASALFAGMAGGVYAYYLTFIDPSGMFDILFSVQLVLAALLGGRGTLWGPVLGGFAIELLDEGTNNVFGGTEAHVVVFGTLMVLVLLFLPRGVLPTAQRFLTRRRERAAGALSIDVRAKAAPAPIRQRAVSDAVLLDVQGLRKSFGGVRAVDDLLFQVREGTITGLIGPTGSGTTTAFNLIQGMSRADAGEVWFDGRRIDRLSAFKRAHLGLGRTFQITRLFREMT